MTTIKHFHLPLETNAYVVHNETHAFVVDLAANLATFSTTLKKKISLNAHSYYPCALDQFCGNAALKAATGATILLPSGDRQT